MIDSDSFFVRGVIKPTEKFFIVITYNEKGKWYLAHSQLRDNQMIFSSQNNKPLYLTGEIKNNDIVLYWKGKLATDTSLMLHPCRDVPLKLHSGLWYGMTSDGNSLNWTVVNSRGKEFNTNRIYHAFLPKRYYTQEKSLYTFIHYQNWSSGIPVTFGTTDGKTYDKYQKHRGRTTVLINKSPSESPSKFYRAMPKYKSYQKNIYTLNDLKKNTIRPIKQKKKQLIQDFEPPHDKKPLLFYWIILVSCFLVTTLIFLYIKIDLSPKKNKEKNDIQEYTDNESRVSQSSY